MSKAIFLQAALCVMYASACSLLYCLNASVEGGRKTRCAKHRAASNSTQASTCSLAVVMLTHRMSCVQRHATLLVLLAHVLSLFRPLLLPGRPSCSRCLSSRVALCACQRSAQALTQHQQQRQRPAAWTLQHPQHHGAAAMKRQRVLLLLLVAMMCRGPSVLMSWRRCRRWTCAWGASSAAGHTLMLTGALTQTRCCC
jgi:hypothetical protein